MVGKIWIIDENKDTVKIKESIQGKLCRIFSNHKVSYNNNIFYVSSTLYEQEETVEEAQQKLSKEMSIAIRKVANSIEPDEIICSMLETKAKTIASNYDEFFNKLQYVDMTPDDYCRYSEEPLMKEEEKEVKPQEELLDTEPKEDENDKIQKRIVLYKKLVAILVTIAGILIIMALLGAHRAEISHQEEREKRMFSIAEHLNDFFDWISTLSFSSIVNTYWSSSSSRCQDIISWNIS